LVLKKLIDAHKTLKSLTLKKSMSIPIFILKGGSMQPFQGSVFSMSCEDIQWYSENRLYPNKTPKGGWGCASITGFLAPGEDLLECCKKDQKKLKEKRVTYETLAKRIIAIVETARKEGQEKLVEGKFKVTISKEAFLSQFCPFSPRNADDNVTEERASKGYFGAVQGYCGILGDKIITILNVNTNRFIKFGNLLPHLIEQHHFFEGKVVYRLSPEEVIDVLEIESTIFKSHFF
jgi:hypothetical protein